MKKFVFMIFLFISIQIGHGQDKLNYLFRQELYSHNVRNMINNSSHFESYRIITPGYFDANNDNVIEYDLLERALNEWYPQKGDTGYLVIDWERQYFKDLKKYDSSDNRFFKAQKGFSTLIKAIRSLRPNLKIAIYGIPYRFNYHFQRLDNTKFGKLLKEADFIAPSLYIPFLEERNSKKNFKFLEENLTDALKLGARIDKPVIPFVWYMYSGAFSTTKGRFIPVERMKKHLEFIEKFSVDGKRVESVLWWDQSKRSFDSLLKSKNNQLRSKVYTHDDVFNYYSEIF